MQQLKGQRKHWQDVLLVVVFLTAIGLPAIVQICSNGEAVSASEKRRLAARPRLTLNGDELRHLPQGYDKYLEDRFGLRRQLLRMASLLRWKLGFPINDKVVIGKNGWLFLNKTADAIAQYRGIKTLADKEIVQWIATMEARAKWLSHRGIPLFVLVAPAKPTIYPEWLPKSIGPVIGPTSLDRLVSRLDQEKSFVFVDCRDALWKAKRGRRVYYKADSHWNDVGGFIAYGELMKRVKEIFPHINQVSAAEYAIREEKARCRDLATMLDLDGIIQEISPQMVHLGPSKVKRFQQVAGKRRNGPHTVYVAEGPEGAPRVLFFHDSFGWAMSKYVMETFSRTYLVHHGGGGFEAKWVERFHPDLVIYEIAERSIPNLLRFHDSLNGEKIASQGQRRSP